MARALIVGCGCRGRALGSRLLETGWEVRGSTRSEGGVDEIRAAGIEPVIADPDRVGTVLDHVSDVTVAVWLMGTALGEPEVIAAIHGPRLERFLENLVDTPVRGFVYEAAGRVQRKYLDDGAALAAEASRTWSIPTALVEQDPADHPAWLEAAVTAVTGVIEHS